MKRLKPAVCLLVLCAVSCASTAPVREGSGGIRSLPSGAALYGFADVARAKDIAAWIYPELFNDKNAAAFAEQSETAVFGVYQYAADGEAPASRGVFMAVRGDYPVFSYNTGFALSPKWKARKEGERKWWRQGGTALSISTHEAFVRLGTAPEMQDRPVASGDYALAAAFDEALAAAGNPALLVMAGPAQAAGLIRRAGLPLAIPLGGITAVAFAEEGGAAYRLSVRLTAKSASEAKALAAILSLARAAVGKSAQAGTAFALLPGPPSVDGQAVTMTGGPLSAETLGRLIAQFLL